MRPRDAGFVVTFFVPGKPRGKGRPRAVPLMRNGTPVIGKGNRPILHVHTDEQTESYEALVKQAAAAAMDGMPPCSRAVMLDVNIGVIPPQSWSEVRRAAAIDRKKNRSGQVEYPNVKPDMDNILKAIMDGCNGIVFEDDKHVVRLWSEKNYASIYGVNVIVRSLD